MAADRGSALFQHHCAVCHGDDGNGETAVSGLLLPRPTAFRDGLFKLVSTANGVPTEDDLVATLRRGMPGSTMMAWGWMPEDDLRSLARHVRKLAVTGRAATIAQTAEHSGSPLSDEQALAIAERQFVPGPAIDGGAPREASASDVIEGRRLFERHCAGCHGVDGRGVAATASWPTDGTWLWPRDLTAGWLRGGASHRELANRIRAGMPGARMPPVALSTAETELLVAYVKTLVPEEAADHHVQWRRTIRTPRVAKLPDDGDDLAFGKIEAVRLPTTPLWWRAEAVSEATLRAAHDGEQFVLRLEWSDGTRNDRARPDRAMGDGVAVQFARSQDPPLFAMGSADAPVNVWRWHAFDPKETAGMLDLLGGVPHRNLDVPIGSTSPAPRAESIQLAGVGTVADATGGGIPLQVTTAWRDGRWTATFRRALRARSAREVDLVVGEPTLFALAFWNGSIDTSPASKSITTWHVLLLQP